MKRMSTTGLLLALAGALATADEAPPRGGRGEANGLSLVQPSPIPPMVVGRPVRGRVAADPRSAGAPTGDLAGLRGVSLREGRAVIELAGAARTVQPGDRIGAATVKAVGADRIILERSAPAVATIVVTFGPGGAARVRTYAPLGTEGPPPEVR